LFGKCQANVIGFEEMSKFEWGEKDPTYEFEIFSIDAYIAFKEESDPITLISIPEGSWGIRWNICSQN